MQQKLYYSISHLIATRSCTNVFTNTKLTNNLIVSAEIYLL